jgi:hypothetical protein
MCRHLGWVVPPLDETATAPAARDDPGWADVPDRHLVDVADGVQTVTELEA